ncbi:MAG: phosphate acyltransferase PlsX [Christensenellaceae bacterium]|jgi:glycerol-3-phosphate acyltransferase PlsX|nr:phosphate acyltransferase PlsX [Christensenellaceae bacterium]
MEAKHDLVSNIKHCVSIIVDAFGGDNSPVEIIKGSIIAINLDQNIEITFTGDETKIKKELSLYKYDSSRIRIVHAPEIVTNDDSPVEAIRTKKESSIVKGLLMLNSDENSHAFISAGSSGGVLTASTLLLRRIKGVTRPALVPILPTINESRVALIDCGANADCKTNNLIQFAYMGVAFAKSVLNVENPRVGLLSNGAEDKKGNELNKSVFPILADAKSINFLGNVEARDILSGDYDVIVTDGFSGNIALKASEGVAQMLFKLIKTNILEGGLRAKIGYLLLKHALKKVAKLMDYNNKGGAVLLGLEKLVIKTHGSSKADSITAAIFQAKHIVDSNLLSSITEEIKQLNS